MITTAQLDRTARDLSLIAKEQVAVEQISGALYAFGSELAVLRIFAKYNANGAVHNPNCRIGFSQNMQMHFFSLELIYG